MITFNVILEGCSEDQARDYALGLDWLDVETSEQTVKYKNYIDTINGVAIWYDYSADYYFFSDEG